MIVFFQTCIEYEEPADVVEQDNGNNNNNNTIRTLSPKCSCDGGHDPNFPFELTPKRVVEEFCPPRFVKPVATISNNPLLNGLVTDLENEVFDWNNDKMYLNPIADLEQSEKLSLLKAIKQGRLPFLTLHNLSLIFQEAPYLNRHSHLCIFCGIRCSNLGELHGHIQKIHTGFVAVCQICGQYYSTEKAAYDHAKGAHEYVGKFEKCCPKSKQIHTNEGLKVGHTIVGLDASLIPSGQFRREFKSDVTCTTNSGPAAKILETLSAETNGMSEEDKNKKKKALFSSMMN